MFHASHASYGTLPWGAILWGSHLPVGTGCTEQQYVPGSPDGRGRTGVGNPGLGLPHIVLIEAPVSQWTQHCVHSWAVCSRDSFISLISPLAFELSTEWLVLSKIWDVWRYCFSEIKTCSQFLPVLRKGLNMNFFILRIKDYAKNIVNRTWKSFSFSPRYLHQ